jgi:hypothetical protein
MANRWILYVKQFALKNNISYGCAISNPECKANYKSSVENRKKAVERTGKSKK